MDNGIDWFFNFLYVKALRKAGHAKPKAVRKGKPVDPADPKDQGEGAPKGK
ncbi:hypothetical protein [Serratia marcescens]|uniref:hypothetical protein n=1 Tax=Serratia marcescens TaxID=615 RepID=UPI003EE1507E